MLECARRDRLCCAGQSLGLQKRDVVTNLLGCESLENVHAGGQQAEPNDKDRPEETAEDDGHVGNHLSGQVETHHPSDQGKDQSCDEENAAEDSKRRDRDGHVAAQTDCAIQPDSFQPEANRTNGIEH